MNKIVKFQEAYLIHKNRKGEFNHGKTADWCNRFSSYGEKPCFKH
jgi:hypothetical protein